MSCHDLYIKQHCPSPDHCLHQENFMEEEMTTARRVQLPVPPTFITMRMERKKGSATTISYLLFLKVLPLLYSAIAARIQPRMLVQLTVAVPQTDVTRKN